MPDTSMKKFFLLLTTILSCTATMQAQNEIQLLVRGDDIGSFRSANLACIDSYTGGIMRSVEIMACCPWFPEAVKMLNENPGLDVGVHLMITSEWEGCKWAPLTKAPSLTDKNGHFYPFIWPNSNAPGASIQEHEWKLAEIEAEFRAQIELVKKHVPHVSHVTGHMGCSGFHPDVTAMTDRLAKEYGLHIETKGKFTYMPVDIKREMNGKQRAKAFAKTIENLDPGIYMFVEHPAYDTPETRGVGHIGYEDVAADRQAVTEMFMSPVVKKAIKKKGVKLISYKDLK